VSALRLRSSARAIILDEADRILLCRFEFPRNGRLVVVWATPGGGVESGETLLAALRRELREEVGLEIDADPPHVWHQEIVRAGHIDGYDGAINDYFLVRTTAFSPHGSLTDEELAAENVTGLRWWTLAEIAGYQGTDLFGPRALGTLLAGLLADGWPDSPVLLSL
jgi:8-oxo-dGTP diphosphatase